MSTSDAEEDSLPFPPRVRTSPPSSAANSVSSADRAVAEPPPEGECGCRTPTSTENRIQPELACPPPPRKPKRTATRKRPRTDNLLQEVSREEIEAFFLSFEFAPPKSSGSSEFRSVAKKTSPCK
ncbi:hypothetical protein SAY87_007826 [Trapa incisa]|uniref:Cyclin-dependent protein kinase inhibitor SMR1 n=1 Tax=Trapa incisa TaxID=236973 RepID=A0AAN7KJ75_9MYRT|nr:hypothetical protein SAY87_007826 [Trapa incisa]